MAQKRSDVISLLRLEVKRLPSLRFEKLLHFFTNFSGNVQGVIGILDESLKLPGVHPHQIGRRRDVVIFSPD